MLAYPDAAAIAAVEPGVVKAGLEKAVAMILFGMINWTFTWLRPGGPISYTAFAEQVIGLLEQGLAGGAVPAPGKAA